jgi:hypothetical protein
MMSLVSAGASTAVGYVTSRFRQAKSMQVLDPVATVVTFATRMLKEFADSRPGVCDNRFQLDTSNGFVRGLYKLSSDDVFYLNEAVTIFIENWKDESQDRALLRVVRLAIEGIKAMRIQLGGECRASEPALELYQTKLEKWAKLQSITYTAERQGQLQQAATVFLQQIGGEQDAAYHECVESFRNLKLLPAVLKTPDEKGILFLEKVRKVWTDAQVTALWSLMVQKDANKGSIMTFLDQRHREYQAQLNTIETDQVVVAK